ncbi:hypothetical protein [Mycolicibacterium hippocampi]|uniref:hypothetical protein n=1 Tax=Mycolicibacterium hippocampi TaxID=659824 RepID=UPI0013D3B367|nr:hypothetical protein [Mycolicibacterium hippocampi]
MSTADEAELWRLRSVLADQLDAYPVETWPEPLVAAVVGVLGRYAAGMLQDRPLAPVLKLVRPSPPPGELAST